MSIKNFFSKKEQDQIIFAIEQAELNTSGEIRVHIEPRCKMDVMQRAIQVFEKLKMNQTEQRNGVLFYLATKDKKFAILGDKGINEKVDADFWDEIKNEVEINFKNGKFTEGIVTAILSSGKQLESYFPYQKNDINELSNEISFEE
jgi:uncharacterized membrane protein